MAENDTKPADDPLKDVKQAVEDEFLKKELMKFAEDLENSSSRAALIPQNFDMPNILNKVSSSEIDLEALRSKRQKIMSDCGVIPQKINISSSESNSIKDDQALEEEA
jgi:hypothetical protein